MNLIERVVNEQHVHSTLNTKKCTVASMDHPPTARSEVDFRDLLQISAPRRMLQLKSIDTRQQTTIRRKRLIGLVAEESSTANEAKRVK